MNPEFGFKPLPAGTGIASPGLASQGAIAIQSSNILVVTKISGLQGQHVPIASPPMHAGSPPVGAPIGWTDPHNVLASPQAGAGIGYSGLVASQYAIRNQQNVDIARTEPLQSNDGLSMKGAAGDEILQFTLGQMNNQPTVLIKLPSGQVIGTLSAEMKQAKEDKHKDKPKKDKKKDKEDKHKDDKHKDKSSKDGKKQFVLRGHDGQPIFRFSGKQKVKEGGKLEMKIKSCVSKEDGNGEVESVGSGAGSFQIKFKSSSHGSTDPYLKCQVVASVIGILDLLASTTMSTSSPVMY